MHFNPGLGEAESINMKRAASLIMALSLLGLVQCHTGLSESEQLSMILESQPGCAAPCWLGITPGVSTEADFLSAVEAPPRDRFDDLERNSLSGGRVIHYSWRDRVMDSLVSSEFENHLATHIQIRAESDIDLLSIVSEFGPPQTYATYVRPGEQFQVLLYLIYEDLGIVIETITPLGEVEITDCRYDLPTELSSLTPIDGFYLFPPAGSEDALNSSLKSPLPLGLEPRSWAGGQGLELSSCPEWLREEP